MKLTTFKVTVEVRAYNSMGNFEKKSIIVCAVNSQEATYKALLAAGMMELETRYVLSVIEHPDEVCYTPSCSK